MVEVFKTDVSSIDDATFLIEQIHQQFVGCKANFDLQDCDQILRIQMDTETIPISPLVKLLNEHGFKAEMLEEM